MHKHKAFLALEKLIMKISTE